ncbi:MAG: curli production assembly/transport protein CsgG [Zetaproteobacteria bacterium CG06_land_8_20_14_3_00_59_53]|nr:MAG: curli production assembly/transport protein CsgG [Zetaproteobacteria bacterium CG23_combo_of_CG06-09_8_20_14_all_59_86]PIQ64901.1 MAG: curli production assembly/transport protein CsgG [Zetaproteobacteria bacterium CG11_big_fil_rev_8_21_14_0_20_59_439]PIU69583.1 MAG: curli production assembly/transport protein CsgG [Zetaproteobacteria bacterium CG06_land_8_20_14_3_00_59_53]PIU96854.1 MAG: curli production assembly/transport protein CsgG [Zetaproteobacteria bacterium CG03_land_8_20_14_0_80
MRRYRGLLLALLIPGFLGACGMAVAKRPVGIMNQAYLQQPNTPTYRDLLNLPRPKGKILSAVYNFRDMTGQYKSSPSSNISTQVTQGAASILMHSLKESQWFDIVEREGLQDLLTERKVNRATAANDKNSKVAPLPTLLPASVLFEGGIVGYDTNVQTGGEGARYLGIGGSDRYQVDQVTVVLRAVDVRNGRILETVETSKTILSEQIAGNVYRFIAFKALLEGDVGYSYNEPGQMAAQEAIQAAIIHLIARGILNGLWELENPDEINSPVLEGYL